MLDLSIIIVNFHTEELTKNCIDSVIKNTKKIKYEIVVVDSESTNYSFEQLNKSKHSLLLRSKENLGFTGGNNLGMKEAKGKYVLLLNSDTLIHDNVLGEMVEWMDGNSQIGISTCALKNKDGSLQATGGYFPTLPRVFSWMIIQDLGFVDKFILPFHPKVSYYKKEMELDWLTGAFMLIRREVIEKIHGFDEEYFMYTEDTDLCYRTRSAGSGQANWKIVYNSKWSITHFGGASSIKEFPLLSEFRGVKLFYRKHYPRWQYLPLRFLLKLGSIWRMLLISPKIYAKAFRQA